MRVALAVICTRAMTEIPHDAPQLSVVDPIAEALRRIEDAAARIAAANAQLPSDGGADARALARLRQAIADMATNIDRTIDALDADAAAATHSPPPLAVQVAMGVE